MGSKRKANIDHEVYERQAIICKAFANPTRLQLMEILTHGNRWAAELQEGLGISKANLSQHLAILRGRQIVLNRKEGNQVFYSLRNPVLVEVLDIMKRYCQSNLNDAIQLLGEMEAEGWR